MLPGFTQRAIPAVPKPDPWEGFESSAHCWLVRMRGTPPPIASGPLRIKRHGLRHTNATVSLANGEDPKFVQERLGHSTISLTLDRYSHVTQAMDREAALRFGAILAAAAKAEDQDAAPAVTSAPLDKQKPP